MSDAKLILAATLLVSVFVALALASAGLAPIGLEGVDRKKIRRGWASWYGEFYRHRLMANGQPYNPDLLTAAAWDWPIGYRVLVRNVRTRASVIVEITDHGPAVNFYEQGRIIDLSRAAFERIGLPGFGVLEVEVEPYTGKGQP